MSCSGVTRLKLWADKVLKNTIINISSEIFIHIFSLVVPLHFLQQLFQETTQYHQHRLLPVRCEIEYGLNI